MHLHAAAIGRSPPVSVASDDCLKTKNKPAIRQPVSQSIDREPAQLSDMFRLFAVATTCIALKFLQIGAQCRLCCKRVRRVLQYTRMFHFGLNLPTQEIQ